MKNIDFSIQDTAPRNKETKYVLLQAGKGKDNFSTIYINPSGFSYIEGLIWDKFREFNNHKKNKILSNEWKRILDGLNLAVESLKESKDASTLKRILKFDSTQPKYSLDFLMDEQENLINMMNELIEWITKFVSKEKYIYVNY